VGFRDGGFVDQTPYEDPTWPIAHRVGLRSSVGRGSGRRLTLALPRLLQLGRRLGKFDIDRRRSATEPRRRWFPTNRRGDGRELGDIVILGEPVRRIAYGDELIVSGDSITVRAAQAIFAISPALAGRFIYEPALPASRDQLTQRIPNGSVIKCMAIYDEPFWRDAGLSGQLTMTEDR